jgi:hypothetical protein
MEPIEHETSEGGPRRLVVSYDARVAAGRADPITPEQRAMAAKVHVMVNERLGVPTEPWIRELADRV